MLLSDLYCDPLFGAWSGRMVGQDGRDGCDLWEFPIPRHPQFFRALLGAGM